MYLTGSSWGEATPYFIDMLKYIRKNGAIMLNWYFIELLNYIIGIRIMAHDLEIIN